MYVRYCSPLTQVKLIRESLVACLGEDNAKLIDVNTIDGFQGREKDIVIFSCVRWVRNSAHDNIKADICAPASHSFICLQRLAAGYATVCVCVCMCTYRFRSLRKDGKGGKGIGFVADERRINVGLTRARCSLLVVGNARALQASPHWASLIQHTMDTK